MKFKVGDRVKAVLVSANDSEYGLKVGDTGKIVRHNGSNVYWVDFINGIFKGKSGLNIDADGTYQMFDTQLELANSNPTITIRQKGRKVIAVMTEDGKYIKSAKAKCSPTDDFDFETGAKLAFDRLMGRKNPMNDKPFDWDGFKQGKFAVHCDTEEKAKAFLRECDEQGIEWCGGDKASSRTNWNGYKGEILYFGYGNIITFSLNLELYQDRKIIPYTHSQVREVKRPAKVGEWIKITNAITSGGFYKNGDILKVDNRHSDRALTAGGITERGIFDSEYVVLENYQPEAKEKSLADFTDKELIDELARRWEDKNV